MHRSHAAAVLGSLAVAFSLGTGTAAKPLAGAALLPLAKITLVHARAIALHAAPGRIVDQELEREGGGSGLRFTFDVTTARGHREVGVDAKTGAVLENNAEAPGN